ncbi:hypothetical protein RE428_48430 [Marinobacter nanhaiticus D15-8W]|uniref:DUF4136 domain-containing protein n=1 Tax=Marinobacter nanhaiticus D15-8W TaxID=626887 RepID=N6VYK3_9GAMM|nr:hypothetical protein [Marinobacter nanhaiticus]ENO15330.1 hypothetical protein J057_08266 [Marinobacter nanhaiticus D15-8W]BES73825.1 hypothetical protein RE428_48430 [Marinobacter nanhaiticus D15-8W]
MTTTSLSVRFLVAALLISLIGACTSTTNTTIRKKEVLEETDKTYNSLVVLAATGNMVYRNAIEKALAEELLQRNFRVFRFQDGDLPWDDKDALRETVAEQAEEIGADGVLVVSFVRKEDQDDYVSMQVIQEPIVTGVGAHAHTYMRTTVQPGYYETRKTYVLETTLFDAESEEAVWRLYSDTVNPRSVEDGAHHFAVAVAAVLEEDIKHSE